MKEEVLNILKQENDALDIITINDLLGLKTSEELQELQSVLNNLVEEYIVYFTKKDKYILFKNCSNLKIGKLILNKKGFGFVYVDAGDDIYIARENLNGATHDDIVLCEILKSGMKPEGKIIKIVKRELKNLVGEIVFTDNKCILELDEDKKDLIIDIKDTHGLVSGHKVLVKIIKQLSSKRYLGEVEKVLGHKNDPGVDILSIAYKYGINPEFGEDVNTELASIPDEVSEEELKNRRDLTNRIIFTIDGDDTKDIDDAISLQMKDNYYLLGVHIADVSHYVKENTALGNAALERGTSSYLADTVIPMIPHQLSNGICSLNEGVVRLTMSLDMEIDKSGKIVNYDIYESFIKSSKRMTYKKVNDVLERNIIAEDYIPYSDTLIKMKELADILRKEKVGRGYIDFDLDEAKVIQDEQGVAIDVIKRERGVGELIIEDFMIAANETIATHIYNKNLPFIYRTHQEPNQEKIDDFLSLVNQLGYHIKGKSFELTPKSMQYLLEQLSEKKEFKILSDLLLRSMSKADYRSENLGHFGLASKAYTHFTSPIRRFPDLMVHRLLRKYLFEGDTSKNTTSFLEGYLVSVAEISSEREVATINAERDVLDMKMAEYMESKIGEEYEGIISGVTNFGFFVQLPNLIEGLVHVNTLKGDYFVYVPELLSLIGKSTKKTYRIGDELKIKVVAASKENSFIDFEVVTSTTV